MSPSGSSRRRARRLLPAAALLLASLGCGDGTFVLIVNTGTIIRDPFCGPGGGAFEMRDQGGLVVFVSIDSNTTVFLRSGSIGSCSDLSAGAVVDVSGTGDDDRISADEVRIQ